MPRMMSQDNPTAYRVKVRALRDYEDGNPPVEQLSYIGPYSNIGTARGQINNAKKDVQATWRRGRLLEFDITVEVADMNWRTV